MLSFDPVKTVQTACQRNFTPQDGEGNLFAFGSDKVLNARKASLGFAGFNTAIVKAIDYAFISDKTMPPLHMPAAVFLYNANMFAFTNRITWENDLKDTLTATLEKNKGSVEEASCVLKTAIRQRGLAPYTEQSLQKSLYDRSFKGKLAKDWVDAVRGRSVVKGTPVR